MHRLTIRSLLVAATVACQAPIARFTADAPRGLAYSSPTVTYFVGTPIADNVAIVSGASLAFTVSPPLPAGLLLNANSGTISGQPTTQQTATDYLVTASNNAGASSAHVSITVAPIPPAVVFVGAPFVWSLNENSTTGVPINSGSPILSCAPKSGTPPLPVGLSVSPVCEVSGFPAAVAAEQTYTLTAGYAVGAGTASVDITVDITVAGAFAIVPSAATLTASSDASVPFGVTGGVAPYTFSLLSGSGAVDTQSGLYANTNASGQAVVQARDGRGHLSAATVTNARLLTNGTINAAIASGTHLLVAGDFLAVNPAYAPGLALLDTQTAHARSELNLGAGFTADGGLTASPPSVVALTADAVILGGAFSQYRGQAVYGLAKIARASGDLDPVFSGGAGIDGAVTAMRVDGDSLFVAGQFASYRGEPVSNLIKVDLVTGERDATFGAPMFAPGDAVTALQLLPDGLVVGGGLSQYQGRSVANLIKVSTADASLVSGFRPNTDTSEFPIDIGNSHQIEALASDGSALFASLSAPAPIVKLAPDGSIDSSFASAPTPSARALLVLGSWLFVGLDTDTGTGGTPNLLRLSTSTGALDSGFHMRFENAFAGNDEGGVVAALATDGQTLYAGGSFSTLNDAHCAAALVALDPATGAPRDPFAKRPGLTSNSLARVSSLALDVATQTLAAAGDFQYVGGVDAQRLARIDLSTGRVDPSFAPPLINAEVNGVTPLASDNSLLVYGAFNGFEGDATRHLGIVKLDAASGAYVSAFNVSFTPSTQPFVYSAITHDGKVDIGGDFVSVTLASNTMTGVARVDATSGALDGAFFAKGGFNGDVTALAYSEQMHRLIAGGSFTSYNGTSLGHLGMLDDSGIIDDGTYFTAGDGPGACNGGANDASVSGLLMDDSGQYLTAYGGFSAYCQGGSSLPAGGYASAFIDYGSAPAELGPVLFFDNAVTAFAPNTFFFGGTFANYSYPNGAGFTITTPVFNLVKLVPDANQNETVERTFSPVNAGLVGTPKIIVPIGASLFVGGTLESYRGAPVSGGLVVDQQSGFQIF